VDLHTDPSAGYWQSRVKFQDRKALHLALLLLTVASTTYAGTIHYLGFRAGFGPVPSDLSGWQLAAGGLWYSGTILGILGCHELGHYLACRYYDVDASRPYFLPMPLLFTGTLGAFIRIREPIPSKRMLFDIGVAGPLAGFLVAVPALVLGFSLSNVVPLPDPLPEGSLWLGEPLIYKAVGWAIWGSVPDGSTINMHPMLFGAWFGLIATALNLIPIGQLDGGHISYAVLGRRSSLVTLVMLAGAIILAYFSTSWIVWTIVMIAMLTFFGRHHPPTYDEQVPLDGPRLALAAFAMLMLVVCFTPVPIEALDVIRR
jgi:membrane-associated protease RseP (regulator of RpoE activity)